MKPRNTLLWLNTRRLAMVILFAALFAMAARTPADTDTWWHLQAGRVTMESGRILQSDVFSHTRQDQPWINHSWLSQVLLYFLFNNWQYFGLGLFQALVVSVTFAFVYVQMEGDVFTRAFIVVLAATTSAVVWISRPQLFSFLLTAVLGYLLYLYKWRRVNRLWLIPPLFVLWVNLHAGYALGFIVLVGFVAGEVFNNLLVWILPPADENADPIVSWRGIGVVLLVFLVSVFCLLFNPNTVKMWTYYLDTVSIGVLQDFIQEWSSPNFHPLYTQPFIWLLLATLSAVGLSGRRIDGSDLALVAGFTYAGLLAGRNIGPFALVAAPVLSRHVRPIIDRWSRSARARGWLRLPRRVDRLPLNGLVLVNWLLLVLIFVTVGVKVVLPLRIDFNVENERRTLPQDAVAWIQEHRPAGPMFNSYNWGGYLIWHLWPDYLVFVDGRTDLYGDELLNQYLQVRFAQPGFLDVFDEYGVNFVLTEAGGFTDNFLTFVDDWELAYTDDVAVIYVRKYSER
ncbi:MAG: hypothetical protein GY832_20685 [Chloroflexi bacterium]|nr:hypothetical protein [Chloroflexota bacterium]